MAQYLRATGRDEVASWAEAIGEYLEADMDVVPSQISFTIV